MIVNLINGRIKSEIGYHIRGDKHRKGYAKKGICNFKRRMEQSITLTGQSNM